MNKTKIVTLLLLSLLSLSVLTITNINTYVQAADVPAGYTSSGQIAVAHWAAIPVQDETSTTTIGIDAFFVDK
jgi:hypothetical protein